MSTAEKKWISPREYLVFERASRVRHEYYNGEIFAMTGASRNHNRLSVNLARRLAEAFDDGRCEVFMNDMRVKVDETGLYTYPDAVVTCGESRFEDDELDTLLNPRVVIEILSDSTEKYDRGEKFAQYRNLESLSDYILVSQHRPRVEYFSRRDDGSWLMRTTEGLEDSFCIPSIDVVLDMADLYARIDFDSPGEAGAASIS